MTRVLAISGSLRKRSHNTGLIRAVAEHAPEDMTVEIYNELESLPPYNEDRDTATPPPAVAEMRRRVEEADVLLFSTPEYNGTIPGQLKQLVDWASRPHGPSSALFGKSVAVVGVSASDYGAVWAQDHLRKALATAGARVLQIDMPVGGSRAKFDETGELIDEETIDRIEDVLETIGTHHRAYARA